MGEPNSVIRKMLELREVIIYGSLLLKLEQSPMGVIVKKKVQIKILGPVTWSATRSRAHYPSSISTNKGLDPPCRMTQPSSVCYPTRIGSRRT